MTKYIYHFVKNGSMSWVFHQHIQMTFEMRDKKKSELFDKPKIQKEMTEYLEDIVLNENWNKLSDDATDEVKPLRCPVKKGLLHLKKRKKDNKHQ